MRTISHFINGQSVTRAGAVTSPVYDPSTGEVQARLQHGDAAILAEAVAVAKAAQPTWAAMNPCAVSGYCSSSSHCWKSACRSSST
jgi:malonate-semialdehyde dehydrogenase (acetylating)/methylmalonate-semialdehyde dehydrogenase